MKTIIVAVCVSATLALTSSRANADDKTIVREASAPKKWAILVGVEDYVEAQDLTYCGDDVRGLRTQLLGMGFRDDHTFLLHDDATDRKWLPAKSNIEAAFDLLLGRLDAAGNRIVEPGLVEQNDIVVLAFSGHGVNLHGESYLCPSEARLDRPESLVPLNRIYRQLELSAAGVKLLLVDACRNDPRPDGRKSLEATDEMDRFAKSLESPPRGVLVLQSCAAGQVSVEDKDFGHGVFLHYVIEGLAGSADAIEGNRDGRVSLLELYRYSSGKTKLHVARTCRVMQTPSLRGEISGDFDFGLAKTKPAIDSDPALRLFRAGELTAARKLVREAYKADYDAAKSDNEKVALAERMIQDTKDTEAAVDAYVALEVARDISVLARHQKTALRALDAVKERFGIDVLSMKASVLTKLQQRLLLPVQHRDFVVDVEAVIDESIGSDRHDIAIQLANNATSSALRSNDQALAKKCRDRLAAIQNLANEFQTVQAAMVVLKSSPTDAHANLAVGRHLCFVKSDWANGLPKLAISSDAQLRKAAEQDLTNPDAPADQIAVGDLWWTLGDKQADAVRDRLQQRAAVWYLKSVDHVSGIHKTRLQRRLASLQNTSAQDFNWIDLLDSIVPKEHTVYGPWTKKGSELMVAPTDPENHYSACMLPYEIKGDFELCIEFTRTAVTDREFYTGIHLPVGKSHVMFSMCNQDGLSGLNNIDGKSMLENSTRTARAITNGTRHKVLVRVRYRDADIEIDSTLDDEAFVSWKGPQRSLSIEGSELVLPASRILVGCRYSTGVIYHTAKIRLIK